MARAYRYITSRTSPNQNARNAKIQGITIHWWGKPSGQKVEGIVNWLCDKRAGTSAHYVVSDGVVYCIVDPDRRAWHAGNSRANHTQIGIELDPNKSKRAGTQRTAAALIADLRAQYGDLPLSPHKRWTSTECPGDWDLADLDRLARGQIKPVAPSVPSGGVSKPVVKPATGKLAVDGVWGRDTSREVQSRLGVAVDGVVGPKSLTAWQRHEGTPADGRISGQTETGVKACPGIRRDCIDLGGTGSTLIRTLQTNLNKSGAGLQVDGKLGPNTVRALQSELNRNQNALR